MVIPIIRPVTISDAKGVAALRETSLNLESHDLLGKFENEINLNIGSDRWAMFVAESKGNLIGYGRCEKYEYLDERVFYETTHSLPEGWYLRGVVISPEFQRKGIALLLTRIRIEWLKLKTNQVYCFLDSDEKSSIPLYLKLGFKEISRDWTFQDHKRLDTGILFQKKI